MILYSGWKCWSWLTTLTLLIFSDNIRMFGGEFVDAKSNNGSLLLQNNGNNLREINSSGSGSHIIIQHSQWMVELVLVQLLVMDGLFIDSPTQVVGVLTATQFVGDGSLLTGIVASGTGITIQEEGSNVGTASTINFVGAAVTATISSGTATVSVQCSTTSIWW